MQNLHAKPFFVCLQCSLRERFDFTIMEKERLTILLLEECVSIKA